jgi:predicted metal-dependent hydrolase
VSKKSGRIAQLIESCRGQKLDPYYLGYFRCFNDGLFYESHDVLEELWLGCRKEPRGNFYKGLIQFAGAFVHLKKGRLKPAAALFRLSSNYLNPYRPSHEHLHVEEVLQLASDWIGYLEEGRFAKNPLTDHPQPILRLSL